MIQTGSWVSKLTTNILFQKLPTKKDKKGSGTEQKKSRGGKLRGIEIGSTGDRGKRDRGIKKGSRSMSRRQGGNNTDQECCDKASRSKLEGSTVLRSSVYNNFFFRVFHFSYNLVNKCRKVTPPTHNFSRH